MASTWVYAVEQPLVFSIEPFQPEWYSIGSEGQKEIHLYFFWSKTCPHCRRAKPFVATLEKDYAWLKIHNYELTNSQENIDLYIEMTSSLEENANAVPAFLFCEKLYTGYDNETGMGTFLKRQLETCYQAAHPELVTLPETDLETESVPPLLSPPIGEEDTLPPLHVPGMGEVNVQQLSLPVLTLTVAGLDAFNPCAFFCIVVFIKFVSAYAPTHPDAFDRGDFYLFFRFYLLFIHGCLA
jgi:thiol-disulfide isomerase/thioredoxin